MKSKTKPNIKKASLYLPSGFLPCDIDMEREYYEEEGIKEDFGDLLHSLIHMRMDSLVLLENLWNQYCKLNKEERKLVTIEEEDHYTVVTGPEIWIDKLIAFDILDEIKEKDSTPDILKNPIT